MEPSVSPATRSPPDEIRSAPKPARTPDGSADERAEARRKAAGEAQHRGTRRFRHVGRSGSRRGGPKGTPLVGRNAGALPPEQVVTGSRRGIADREPARLIGRRVMRPATRLVTPWWRSSTPRTRNAGARATNRNRFHMPRVQITFTRPVSSSRFRNTVPLAVAGCWRWVTTPATSTTERSGSTRRSAAVTTPWRINSARTNSVGCRPGERPIDHRSDATSSGSVMPGNGGASRPVSKPGRVSTTAPELSTCGRASRNAPAAHIADRRV